MKTYKSSLTALRVLPAMFAFVALLFGAGGSVSAQSASTEGKCSVPADTAGWMPQEQLVWERVCAGLEADFNKEPAQVYGGNLAPNDPKGFPESRILSSKFLTTILLDDKYRRALTRFGVRIAGARFTERLELHNAELGHELWLDHSLFEKGADLSQARSMHSITSERTKMSDKLNLYGLNVSENLYLRNAEFAEVSLQSARVGKDLDLRSTKVARVLYMFNLQVEQNLILYDKSEFGAVNLITARVGNMLNMTGAKVHGKLDMIGLQVGKTLYLRDHASFAEINLSNAHAGELHLSDGTTVSGALNMDGLRVEGKLYMHKSEFANVVLTNANVGDWLNLDGSKITGTLNLNGIQVAGNLTMRDHAEFAAVTMRGARMSGLTLNDSKFNGQLDIEGSSFRETVILGRGAVFAGKVLFIFNKVEGNLELAGGFFQDVVNLSGTKINSELRLGSVNHHPAQWHPEKSALILRNASAVAIQDLKGAWPEHVDLNGFSYRSLGGIYASEKDSMYSRSYKWFRDSWLGKQIPFTPEPYEQLAQILQSSGQIDKATAIRYASREKERADAAKAPKVSDKLKYIGLTMLKASVGYGHYPLRSLIWVVLLVIVGALVFRTTPAAVEKNAGWGIIYSFDMLLPIIKLNEKHMEIDIAGWQRYYFYFHKIMGFLLASFLLAGISGLTR